MIQKKGDMGTYATLDYLSGFIPSASSRAAAPTLTFSPSSASFSALGYERAATYFESGNFAFLRDLFKIDLVEGATYYIYSSSFFDPFLLSLHDADGRFIAVDSGTNYGNDTIRYVAPYTGTYYIDASWDQGLASVNKGVSLQVYEDSDTVRPVDQIQPTVTAFSPVDEATGAAISSNIVLTFSEAMQRGTGLILLKASNGALIASYDAATSPNITVSGSTLTLNPTADLTAGTRYVVEFQAGSVKDLAGNNYAGTTSYNFTTAAPVGRVLSGTNGNDTLFGTIGQSEIINALGGDDRITIGGDEVSDSVSGGDGFDTVVFTNDKADYLISKSPSSGSYDVISKRGVVNFIDRDVERLEFRDGTVDPSTFKYYGTATAELPGSVSSVFRFFNNNDNAFFYTNSVAERNTVLANSDISRNNVNEWSYIYQGSSFEAAHTYAGAVPLERFYNTLTKHHFFTSSQSEAATVKANSASGAWPFVYEGVSFNVYASDPTPNSVGQEIPVERFYSAVLNRHWFTADPTEIAQIRLTGLWADEGVGYWAEKPGP